VKSSAAMVRPIKSRSVAEQVMTELRRSILAGALEPGREFSLRELAEMLQVSIIPVREALRSLENQGLVQMRPGRSAIVAPLDLDELQGI
jgi:DNA-binding GntR family transcriptional regulator